MMPNKLDNLKRLMADATPAPWQCEEMGSEGWTVFANRLTMPHMRTLLTNLSEGDARLMVAIRNHADALIAAADMLATIQRRAAPSTRTGFEAMDELASIDDLARIALARFEE